MSLARGNSAPEEAVEQVQAVVRPRPRLGVVLHRPARHLQQLEPLDRAVVEVHVRQRGRAEVRLPAHRLVDLDRARAARTEHREAVVLRGDLDLARLQVLDRVVGAAVAERQLERLQAHRSTEQLVTEADPPHGLLSHQLLTVSTMYPSAAGSPGPLARKIASGSSASRSVAELSHGYSATRAPRSSSSRTIEPLIPVSITAILGPSPEPW